MQAQASGAEGCPQSQPPALAILAAVTAAWLYSNMSSVVALTASGDPGSRLLLPTQVLTPGHQVLPQPNPVPPGSWGK